MNTPGLSLEQLKQMFLYVAGEIIGSTAVLTQADKAIGDGDHGVGMARGFEAVRERLENNSFESVGSLLKAVGTTLITSVGGASGIIFGTFFRGGAERLLERREFQAPDLGMLLSDGLEAVMARGGARPGDKTVVDALEPAVRAVEAVAVKAVTEESHPQATVATATGTTGGATVSAAAEAAAEAAREGVERTKEMIARIGKAKTLGERSLGHPDPGAVSMHLILRAFADFIHTAPQTPSS